MKVTVLSVGRLRAPWADDVAHYEKLLGRHCRLELVELRDGARLAARIPGRAYLCLLAEEGATYDSVGFSRFIEQRRMSGIDLCFVVGGAYGGVEVEADHRLSLGPMTLPHQLARVVLLEQLYRAHSILAGEPYHHG